MSMTEQEIAQAINDLVFSDPKINTAVINLPFHIPKSLFMEKITGYANHKGWQAELLNMTTNEMEVNPTSPLQYVCDRIRDDLRLDFETFFLSQMEQGAKAQGQQVIKQVSGD